MLFGSKLRQLRKKLNLTQNDVSQASGVNIHTIRRIEAGKVLPKLDTLGYLSPLLKEDLHALLMRCRLDDYYIFHNIKNRIEHKFDEDETHSLNQEYKELLSLNASIRDDFYGVAIDQLLLFTSATLSYKADRNPQLALDELVEAMKKTTPEFNLDQYSSFIYTDIELRILMQIALVINKLGMPEQYTDILIFCANQASQQNTIYPKILYNVAGAYIRKKEYAQAEKCIKMAIDWCVENRIYIGLHLMYYTKGLSEYKQGKPNFADALKKSILLCEVYGYPELKQKIRGKLEKFLSEKFEQPNH